MKDVEPHPSYVNFAYNTAVQEMTQMTPYKFVYERTPAPRLEAKLPNITDEENLNVSKYLQRAEEARQPARLRVKNQQTSDSRLTIFDDAS